MKCLKQRWIMKINLSYIKELHYYNEISSTNDIALANIDKDEFTLFIAEKQTKGRGRNQREWFSPSGKNLYFSFILTPEVPLKYLTSLPLYIAFAVFSTVKNFFPEKKVEIKWPNDILVNGKKISGVLIEIKKGRVVVGIGINVNIDKFPEFEHNKATSFFIESCGKYFEREEILKLFFEHFKKAYELFKNNQYIIENLLREINNVLYLKNEIVKIQYYNKDIKTGKVVGVTKEGFLQLDKFVAYAGDVKKVLKGELWEKDF